jgi:glycosyltransferase involved in cell wall biosynthesis
LKLSVIIPTFNEADYIGKLVQSLNEMDDLDKEIIFSDGGSDDGTREKIAEAAEKYGNIVLVDNPGRYVSHAFNNACKVAKGDYIALIGAHSVYPADYFRVCVDTWMPVCVMLRADSCSIRAAVPPVRQSLMP